MSIDEATLQRLRHLRVEPKFHEEECDRLLHYMEEIMDITSITSSDGLLNEWRYGFDPTKL